MDKKLLNSDKEYFNLCVEERIGRIPRKYSTQNATIGNKSDSVECDYFHNYKHGSAINTETLFVERKPKSYPCIFVWYLDEGDHDHYYGRFVYPEDFK